MTIELVREDGTPERGDDLAMGRDHVTLGRDHLTLGRDHLTAGQDDLTVAGDHLAAGGEARGARSSEGDRAASVGDLLSAAAIKRTTLSANGLRFDVLSAGPATGELVLFLHGFPQFADSWLGMMRGLAAKGFRCVAFDQRGYSAGARPEAVKSYGLGSLVSDALEVAAAETKGRFHVVGHDWGGAVAWTLAAMHPERLRSLTVLSTPHLDAFRDAVKRDPVQRRMSSYMVLFRAPWHLAELCLLSFNASLLRKVYGGKVEAVMVEANVRRFRQGGALTGALNWYRAGGLRQRLGRIAVPTLYVWGDADVALGEKAALGTAQYVDGLCRFERLRGRSHWLVDEVPDEIEALIESQISSESSR